MLPTPVTISLLRPVHDGPRIVRDLTMRPAMVADQSFIAKGVPAEEAAILFAARLCGVSASTIRSLDVRDGARVAEALNCQMVSVVYGR